MSQACPRAKYIRFYQLLNQRVLWRFLKTTKVLSAAEPKRAFRNRLRQIEEDFVDLELKTRDLLQALQFQYNLKYDKIQGIVSEIFVGGAASANSIRENLLKAEDEVLFSTGEVFASLQIEDLCGIVLEEIPYASRREVVSGTLSFGTNERIYA